MDWVQIGLHLFRILVIQVFFPDTGSLELSTEAPHSKTKHYDSKQRDPQQ